MVLLVVAIMVALPTALGVAWAMSQDQRVPGPAGSYALRGTLPWSDAFDYWSAAQHLMQKGVLDEWGSRRPLNGAFLAARLGVVGDRLSLALLMQSMVLAAVIAALAVVVFKRMGLLSAVASAIALVAVAAIVQSTLQSEGFGLLLGAAGLALLLRSARGSPGRSVAASRMVDAPGAAGAARTTDASGAAGASRATDAPGASLVEGACGLALLSVAMAVRPGAIFMLPALGAWLLWRHRSRWLRAGVVLLLALVAGSAADRTARVLYASPTAAGNANFAMTVLGLARGTDCYEADRWLRTAHPEERSEAALAREAYAEAGRQMRTAPGTIVGSLVRNELGFVTRVWPLLLLGGIGFVRAPRGERGLWSLGWIGILASVPVIFGDGGIRVLAVTWPFMIASAASALRWPAALRNGAAVRGGATLGDRATQDGAVPRDRVTAIAAFAAGLCAGATLLFALIGPALGRRAGWFDAIPGPNTITTDPFPHAPANEFDHVRGLPALHALLVIGPEDAPDLGSEFRIAGYLPRVTIDALMREPAVIEFGEPLDQVQTPFLLCVVYDIDQSRARVFTLPMNQQTDGALLEGRDYRWLPTQSAPRALRIDSKPLRPGGRVRVGVTAVPVP